MRGFRIDRVFRNTEYVRRLTAACAILLLVATPVELPYMAYAQEDPAPDVPAEVATPAPDVESAPQSEEAPASSGADAAPTASGTDGAAPETPAETPQDASADPTIIATGDATASTDANNSANENVVDTGATSADGIPADTTINADNTGELENVTTADAQTGGNSAASAGPVSIGTGNAYASANVINVLNTNVIDSRGLILLLNLLSGGAVDFSQLLLSVFGSGPLPSISSCTLLSCPQAGIDFNVNADNDATIDNTVLAQAVTGDNSATSASGAHIATGDAYAGANVLNVANTNFIDSNYLLVSINSFGNMSGDLVLPGADFFNALFAANASASVGGVQATTDNAAAVVNDVEAVADSGSNSAIVNSDGSIVTGNAQSSTAVTNQLNTTGIGGSPIRILFRVAGNWDGSVFGLPEGFSWTQTPQGIEIFKDGTGSPGLSVTAGDTEIALHNAAKINNNVSVLALTGNNRIDAEYGAIQTGNALAAANVINVANTNVIGQNWIYAIFNIMGNWHGNLSFGQPNLWIGGAASSDGPIHPGSTVTYKFTIANRGNADASHVLLKIGGVENLMNFDDINADMFWDLGTIPRGHTIEVTHVAHVPPSAPGGAQIPLTATVVPHETDADMSDNTESLPIVLGGRVIGEAGVTLTPDDNLILTKTASIDTLAAPGSVDFTMRVVNKGGPAYLAELFDNILDPSGAVIHQERWRIGTIRPNEEITVSYTAQFGANATPGLYSTSAQVKAITRNPSINPFYGWFGPSNIATSTIAIVSGSIAPQTPSCVRYLDSFLSFDRDNDPEQVRRLQQYLHDDEGAGLAVNGVFDEATKNAVIAYQNKYADDILRPWGIPAGTGVVYFTTRKHINDAHCRDIQNGAFPLSDEQVLEIETFRKSIVRRQGTFENVLAPNRTPKSALEPKNVKTVAHTVPVQTSPESSAQPLYDATAFSDLVTRLLSPGIQELFRPIVDPFVAKGI